MLGQQCNGTLVNIARIAERAHDRLESVDGAGQEEPPLPRHPLAPRAVTSEQAMSIVERVSRIVAMRFPSVDEQEILVRVVREVLSRIPIPIPVTTEKEETESLTSDAELCGFRCRCSSDSSDSEVNRLLLTRADRRIPCRLLSRCFSHSLGC
jgi:hypothetical protein